MSLSSKEIFELLRAEGLPLFLPYFLAFDLLGAPSERALRQAVRRKTCPLEESKGVTGARGFKLSDIAVFLETEGGIPPSRRRGRPGKAEEIAVRKTK